MPYVQVEEEKKTEGRMNMNIEKTWKMTCRGLKRLEGDKNCEETISNGEDIGIGKIEVQVDGDEIGMIPYSNIITKFKI